MTDAQAVQYGVIPFTRTDDYPAAYISRGREWRPEFSVRPSQKGFYNYSAAGRGQGHRLYDAAGHLCGYTCLDLVWTSYRAWIDNKRPRTIYRYFDLAGRCTAEIVQD